MFRRPYKANYEIFLERESNDRELSQPIRLCFKAKIETLASSESLSLSRSPEKINLADFPAKKSVIATEKLLRESMFACEFFFFFFFTSVCEFCCEFGYFDFRLKYWGFSQGKVVILFEFTDSRSY